ncbi:regulator [Streptomyces sp. NPDC047000]|uniref:ATP-binding protein n=1 Tax=Streptomyces sp. NPDC047000 TaxID=3155474 RepID=UPI0033DADF0D
MLSNLPAIPAEFVGRLGEVAHVSRLLRLHRLVTLTGPGGVGKSRLALHSADTERKTRRLTVRWADLWQLTDDRALVAAVADALGFADHTAGAALDALVTWLSGKDLLLVLDSCEHLLPGCQALVGHLLEHCPGLTVLTTGREPLGLPGEHRVEVEPLPASTDAVHLLGRLAAAISRPLTGTPDMIVATRLCRRLEGIPLAVELIAGQLPDRTLEQIDADLASRLDLAATGPRGGPPRHRALRTTIGWSHELCLPAERLLWARLSVFRGAVDAYTVRAVCAGGPLAPPDVMPALAGLERKSVLSRRGDVYHMLDTVREYGRMWLGELGESGELADRHARYYLEMARRADEGWLGPDQTRWYAWIGAVHADLCAALDRLLDVRPHDAVELSGVLGFFWSCCGRLPEATQYLEDALGSSAEPGPGRVRGLWALGVVRVLRGELETGRALADMCRHEAETRGDLDGVLRSAYLMGLIHLLGGLPMAARHVVDLGLQQGGGAPRETAAHVLCRLVRVFALTAQGLLEQARREAEELRRRSAAHGEWWARSYADYQLALIALFEDRAARATAHAVSMLEGKRRIGDSFGVALGLDVLASSLAAQGAGERAAAAFTAGETFWGAVGHPQRGTPELGPVRERYERTARTLLGGERYDDVVARTLLRDPGEVLAELLEPPPGENP